MARDKLLVAFTPEFKRNLRRLAKKYNKIKDDLQPFLDQLSQGGAVGVRVPGIEHVVFKARVKNSSAKGKSGGFRVIYWLLSPEKPVLITIYSKSEQSDVAAKEIKRIIEEDAKGGK